MLCCRKTLDYFPGQCEKMYSDWYIIFGVKRLNSKQSMKGGEQFRFCGLYYPAAEKICRQHAKSSKNDGKNMKTLILMGVLCS